MVRSRPGIRGVMVTEDRRTERFFRGLLVALGFDKRRFDFRTAPSGGGSAEAWVRAQYPGEVRVLRSKRHQTALCLVVVRDGDDVGVEGRKAELDATLAQAGLDPRQPDEAIATPVPTWSIESWLLCLLGHEGIDASQRDSDASRTPWKRVFEHAYADERRALKVAVDAWLRQPSSASELPSIADGRAEIAKIG